MSVEVWGQLPKSTEDPEKIEEAIERIVDEHNEDPTSHLGPTQALESHRAAEIIDHAARSIVGDKINTIEDVGKCLDSGVATGAGDAYIDDSTKDWTTDEFAGHHVLILTGDFKNLSVQIVSNTATRLVLANWDEEWFAIGDEYGITACLASDDVEIDGGIAQVFNGWRAYSTNLNAYVERTFTCNGIGLLFSTGPSMGKVKVYVDDVLQATLDLYTAQEQWRVRMWDIQWETLEERTIKVENIHEKNASSSGYSVMFEAFDSNGVIPFPGIASSIFAYRAVLTTNSNGYVVGDIVLPDGYSGIALVGWQCSGVNSGAVISPKIQIYPYGGVYKVILDDGQPSTAFTVSVWLLIYPNEPLVNV